MQAILHKTEEITECEICGTELKTHERYILDEIGRITCLECKKTKEAQDDEQT